jgi:hypothetical protein
VPYPRSRYLPVIYEWWRSLRSADCAPGPTGRSLAPDPASPAARRLRPPSRAARDRPARWPLGASPAPPLLPARRTASPIPGRTTGRPASGAGRQSSNSRPSASVRLSQATGSPSCGLRVRRQVLMRTMTASSRELQAASTASLADSARLATCGRTLSPPPAMKGSHGSHRPHAAPPWEGRSAGRRSAWDDCGKARRPLADPGPSPGRWR